MKSEEKLKELSVHEKARRYDRIVKLFEDFNIPKCNYEPVDVLERDKEGNVIL